MRKYLPQLQEYLWPLAIIVCGRLGLLLFAYGGLSLMPFLGPDVVTWDLFAGNRWLNPWARWDSGWYKDIAELGYAIAPRFDEQRNVVFFPLYPLAMRVVSVVTRHTGVAGLLVSNSAFLIGMLWLYALVKKLYDRETSKRTLLYASVFPFSFYFSALYPEGLFFALVVGSFVFAHRSQWAIAAGLGALASATRLAGVTLIVGLGFLYFEQIDFQWRRIRPNILWLAFAPLGLVAYAVYLGYRFGDPFIFATGRDVDEWSHGFFAAIEGITRDSLLYGEWQMIHLFNLATGVVAMITVLICWRRLPKAYVLWTLAYFMVSMVGNWFNMGRYIAPAFPIYLATALVASHPTALWIITYISTLALALLVMLFSHWYWVS